MNLYDIIGEIAQKKCDKIYQAKISIGTTILEEQKLSLNNLEFDFEDLIFSDGVCQKLSEGADLTVLCLQTQTGIFVLDKLGEI